jgi:hypothetical protein
MEPQALRSHHRNLSPGRTLLGFDAESMVADIYRPLIAPPEEVVELTDLLKSLD